MTMIYYQKNILLFEAELIFIFYMNINIYKI